MLAAGAAIGATALFTPGAAQAATTNTYTVTTNGDGTGSCSNPGSDPTVFNCDTLRAAISAATGDDTDSVINFDSSLSGQTITTDSELSISGESSDYSLAINGLGRDHLTISAAGETKHRIFFVNEPTTITGLTMQDGYAGSRDRNGNGGGIFADDKLSIADSTLKNNTSKASIYSSNNDSVGGGAIFTYGELTVTGTTITANTALNGGGGGIATGRNFLNEFIGAPSSTKAPQPGPGARSGTIVNDSTISGNSALTGGGIESKYALQISGTTISDNNADSVGGGVQSTAKYAVSIGTSTISGNTAGRSGGGVELSSKYTGLGGSKNDITQTTISGNHAHGIGGGGLEVGSLAVGSQLIVDSSTISGNDATYVPPPPPPTISGVRKSQPNYGGGVLLGAKYSNAGAPTTPNRTQIQGDVSFVDSTIAGNTADHGAGASIGTNDKVVGDIGGKGSISFDNSTIASNSARQAGGGIYLSSYNSGDDPAQVVSSTIPLASTIVADNTANGSPEDLNRAADSTAGGFDLAFSLVENPGNAPLTQDPNKPSTTGQDPQLGALGNNGGLTQTELPAITSPVIDKGHAPNRLKFDQRGVLRSIQVDTIADALNGDATDIGAVERPASDFPPAQKPAAKDKPPVAVIKRLHLDPNTGALSVGGGTAKDDGRVVKVQYELMRKKGNKCMVLTVNGFSGWQTCKKPTAWRTAKGTNKWSVNFNRKFASGYYVLYARATDDVGLVQKKPARATFRIKGARAARRVSPRFTG